MNRAIIAVAAVIVGVAASQGRIITVDDDGPADFNNIRAAIDDANDGDTVLVADGTYAGYGRSAFDCFCKTITVRSENGPENCIVDCNGNGGADPNHKGRVYIRRQPAKNRFFAKIILDFWRINLV